VLRGACWHVRREGRKSRKKKERRARSSLQRRAGGGGGGGEKKGREGRGAYQSATPHSPAKRGKGKKRHRAGYYKIHLVRNALRLPDDRHPPQVLDKTGKGEGTSCSLVSRLVFAREGKEIRERERERKKLNAERRVLFTFFILVYLPPGREEGGEGRGKGRKKGKTSYLFFPPGKGGDGA